ncbi:MAG: DUF5916 domain-containing protein, partial [Chitinophagales bacterium]|nr:DUF5916 domain-containing protein [Chitinophagales bacterium]
MNTMRSGSAPDANVASVHYAIRNKKNSLEATGFGNYSAVSDSGFSNPKTGGYYNISLNETKGKWTEWIWHELITPNYDQNDLGILFGNNQMTVGGGFNYNNQELKKGPFYNVNSWGSLNYKTQVEPFQYQEWEFNTGVSGQFKNFYNIGAFIYSKPLWYYDYYEPRVEGAKYYHAPFVYTQLFFNTDYRKKVALSASIGYGESPEPKDTYLEAGVSPYFILNDHFSFWYDLFVSKDRSNYGFVNFDSNDEIIFGRRNTFRVSNTINAKYTFNPKMNFNFRARYYWGKVTYVQFYELQDEGTLASTDFTGNYDYNFNVFNIDAVYEWEFAPGSFLNLIWKNNIFQSDDAGTDDYFDNFKKTFDSPQSNGISVKLIYYLDYLSLRKKSS